MKLPFSSSQCSIIAGLVVAVSISLSAAAQSSTATPIAPVTSSSSEQASLLPDAPVPFDLRASASDPAAKTGPAATNGLGSVTAEASHTQKYLEPGQVAPTLTANDKVLLGLRDAFSLFSASGWLASAGYEQLVNGSPNYGTDRGAFGQRLGAAAVRDITEGVICDSVMTPILHEDPRYYRLGPSHNFFVRAIYAATRPVITRTDGGHRRPISPSSQVTPAAPRSPMPIIRSSIEASRRQPRHSAAPWAAPPSATSSPSSTTTYSIPTATASFTAGTAMRISGNLVHFSVVLPTLRSPRRFPIQCMILPFNHPPFDSQQFPRKLMVGEHPIRQQACLCQSGPTR